MANITSVGGIFWIDNNPELTGILAFENLTSIGEELGIANNLLLESLNGLQNIMPGSITSLVILGNPQLSLCNVESICSYLLDPGGTTSIQNNAAGCNSTDEILENCIPVTTREAAGTHPIRLMPNPADTKVRIGYSLLKPSLVEIKIVGPEGKQVSGSEICMKPAGFHQLELKLKNLPPGVYFCLIGSRDGIASAKLVIL